jgi:hypothetical protein
MRAPLASALSLLIVLLVLPAATKAQQSVNEVGTDIGTFYRDEAAPLYRPHGYSPYAGQNYPTRVLWGDTHLHTANSFDAAAFGNTLGPEAAYRFARGEEVISSTGQPAKLSRPLDFLVIADHAEGLGGIAELKKGNPLVMTDATVRRWHSMLAEGGQTALDATIEMIRSVGTNTIPSVLVSERLARPYGKATQRRLIATMSQGGSPR